MKYVSAAEREIERAIKSGEYPIASIKMFDEVENLSLSESTLITIETLNEMLYEYLEEILELKDKKPGLTEYLKTLKKDDIMDNQVLERQDSFLIRMYGQTGRRSAIDKLIKYANNGRILTSKDLYDIHKILLYGTLSDNEKTVRKTNSIFVGTFEQGQKVIDFIPIDYHEIEEATNKLVNLYNYGLLSKNYNNVYIEPFIIHGLVASLQMFHDGNTRLARIMQHTLMWQLINEKTPYNFELPPLYNTASYYPYQKEYRDKITSIVQNGNDESWNEWFIFNLRRVEDQIYKNTENIRTLKRKLITNH